MGIAFITDSQDTARAFTDFFAALPNTSIEHKIRFSSSPPVEDLKGKSTDVDKKKITRKMGVEILVTETAAPIFDELSTEYTLIKRANPLDTPSFTSEEISAIGQAVASYLLSEDIETILTGVSSPFDEAIQNAVAKFAPHIRRICFYDSLEDYVPGYSEVAAKVMRASQEILFASPEFIPLSGSGGNTRVPQVKEKPDTLITLNSQKVWSLGYFYHKGADDLKTLRTTRSEEYHQLLIEHFLSTGEVSQKTDTKWVPPTILLYFLDTGSACKDGLTTFLQILKQATEKSNLSQMIILVQPEESKISNEELKATLQPWEKRENDNQPLVIVSPFGLQDSLIGVDGILYHHSIFAHQCLLADVPTMKIGADSIRDVLVERKLVTPITSGGQFLDVLSGKIPGPCVNKWEVLGFFMGWEDSFRYAMQIHKT